MLAIVIRDVTTTFMSRLQLASLPGNLVAGTGASRTQTRTGASSSSSTSSTPQRREPATSSEIDLHALSEALSAGASATPGVDGAHQAASSGVLGHTREAARKLVGVKSDVDVQRLEDAAAEVGSIDVAQLKQERDQEVPQHDEAKQEAGASKPSSTTSWSTPSTSSSQATLTTDDVSSSTNKVSSLTSTSSSASTSAAAAASAAALAANLTPTQQKLLRRSLEWADRVKRALNEVPVGVRLMFFTEPSEVEEGLVRCVREERERRRREGAGNKKQGEKAASASAGVAAAIGATTSLSERDAQLKAEQEAAQEIA